MSFDKLAARLVRPMGVLFTTALLGLCLTISAEADTIYSYTGHSYASCGGSYCTGGPYALSATFDTTLTGGALDNLSYVDISATVKSFQFSDGSGLTVTNSTPGVATSFSITTDASGNIIGWLVGGYANSAQVQMQTNFNSPFGFTAGADFSETTANFAGSYGFVGADPGIWVSSPDPASGMLMGGGGGLLILIGLVGQRKHGVRII